MGGESLKEGLAPAVENEFQLKKILKKVYSSIGCFKFTFVCVAMISLVMSPSSFEFIAMTIHR